MRRALLALAFLQGCSSTASWPEKRPDDFTVRWHRSAGELPDTSAAEISSKGCTYEFRYMQAVQRVEFSMTPGDLDDLYRALRERKFDRIETREEMVHDRGGTSMDVAWKGYKRSVSDSDRSFVADAWREDWKHLVTAVETLVARETEKLKKDFPVRFDAGIDVAVNGEVLRAPTVLKLLPGTKRVSASRGSEIADLLVEKGAAISVKDGKLVIEDKD